MSAEAGPGQVGSEPTIVGVIARHVLLIAGSVLMLYPLLWMLASSFKPEAGIFSNLSLIPPSLNPKNYIDGWNALEVSFSRFYWNSFLIAILVVIGNVMSCSLTAYAFARLRFRGRNILFALMMMTLMLPYHVTLIPQYVLFLNIGWIDTILPLVVPKFLAVDAFFIFLMVQFFRGLPRELDEAAKIDGCGPWRIYWMIILPLSKPVLATAAIFSFLWTWNDFFGPLIYLNDISRYTVPLALRAFVDSTGTSAWGQLFAMSTLAIAPIFLFFLLFQRLIIRGVAMSGLKG
ncbi:MAG: sugar ABC transporter permease [Rhizobiales bacterium 65-9]|nr:carbohydrate ABC transporter permease [Hyphomicrobiales bacterium]OJY35020.1 MAG: sugar ABC transporter permease [Rhizobiales bacterium 65-9]